jgi:hypothetical protein
VYLPVAVAALILLPAMQESRLDSDALQSGYFLVYGVKTVTPSLTLEEAKKRGIRYSDIPQVRVTRLFAVDPSSGKSTLVFSDEGLPVMVLNRYGGGELALYGVVVTNPSRRNAIALMGNRPASGHGLADTSSLYELSLDGSNAIRRIADVEAMIIFAVSRDGAGLAYFLYHPQRLVIRSTDSGKVTGQIGLEGSEFADLPILSWSPDGSVLLVPRWPGPEHETEYDLVHIPEERVVHIPEERIERAGIQARREQGPRPLTRLPPPRNLIYSFFPNSNRLLGVHLTYDTSSLSPLRQFFSMALPGYEAVDLSLPQCRECWQAEVSPDEKLIAYPCDQGILIGLLAGPKERTGQRRVPVGRAEVLGWIVK